jgi:hypothetical protein
MYSPLALVEPQAPLTSDAAPPLHAPGHDSHWTERLIAAFADQVLWATTSDVRRRIPRRRTCSLFVELPTDPNDHEGAIDDVQQGEDQPQQNDV